MIEETAEFNAPDPVVIEAQAREVIARAILETQDFGWLGDASTLTADLESAGDDLRELLIVRDCAERILEELEANR